MGSRNGARLGLLVPMRVELTPIVRRLGLRAVNDGASGPGARRWEGRVGGFEVIAVIAGVGPSAASAGTASLIEQHSPGVVLVAGVAGAVDSALHIGDVVVPAWAVDATTGVVHHAGELGNAVRHESGVVTTDGWLDPAEIHRFGSDGAVIVDMETSAVAAVCASHGVEWSAIRAISDRLADGVVDDRIAGLVGADGHADLGAVARYLVPRPWRVATLIRVGRDSGRATRALADAVAEALSD